MKNPVTRYATLGSCFRYMSVFAQDYYLPAFFLMNYPQFRA